MQHKFHLAWNSLIFISWMGRARMVLGASVVPWKEGRALVWDVTCPDTLAHSYQHISVREAGLVAAEAKRRKKLKSVNLNFSHFFVPVAVETLGVVGPESHAFLRDLAGRVQRATREPLAHQYILQHLSVTVHCHSGHSQAGALRGVPLPLSCLFRTVKLPNSLQHSKILCT